ncbi:MAG: hypothetical protein SCH66_09130 [Methanolobus sp.]|nr:hypothetical protein [Methanolobus sp.]
MVPKDEGSCDSLLTSSMSSVCGVSTDTLHVGTTGIPRFSKNGFQFGRSVYSERQDSEEIRQRMLNISYSEWEKMGFSKDTLHYMKKNAEADKPFTLSAHVKGRLETWESC